MIKLILFIIGLVVASFGVLIWYTSQGSVSAAMTLGGLIVLIVLLIGFGMSQLSEWLNHQRKQQNFIANTEENLAIMASLQKVQNAQNQQLLRQARELPKLASGNEIFDISDYADLDNLNIEGL